MPERDVEEEGRAVSIVWAGLAEVPVRSSNALISQFYQDLFVLNFGFTNAPPLLGTAEEIKRQVEAIESVTVTPIVRIALTERQMEKTIGILQENLARFRESRVDPENAAKKKTGKGTAKKKGRK